MASASPSHHEVTDCPVCKSLCLSPTILPCGHVVCRKCILQTLLEAKGPNPACPLCGSSLPHVSKDQKVNERVAKFPKDPILEDLVIEELASQSLFCLVCPNKRATNVCLDCGDMFCAACASGHKKMTATKDHLQQDLPQAIRNAPSAARASSKSKDDDIISSTSSSDSIRYDHDTRSRQNPDIETLKKEAGLCEEGTSRLKDALTVVDNNITQLQEVKKRLEGQHRLLASYSTRLVRPDDVLLVNTQAMLPRLRRVREDCCPPEDAALAKLTQSVNNLMQPAARATNVQSGGTLGDPLTSVPQRVFLAKPETDQDTDKEGPAIVAIVATDDGQLVMADENNNMVKVAQLNNDSRTVQGVELNTRPLSLTPLGGKKAAVTASRKWVYTVDISGHPTVVSHVRTARQYRGVAHVAEDDTLVVSCEKDEDGPASVDVIMRTGVVLRTVVDGNTLTGLSKPVNLCLQNGEVLVSDFESNTLFRLKLDTGRVVEKLTHPDLRCPFQVATDHSGNCYISCVQGECVLVVTPGGQWRKLLHGPQHGDGPRVHPFGVCVTKSGIVAIWHEFKGYSVVASYHLM